jgi:RNA recognition motif-containing protein
MASSATAEKLNMSLEDLIKSKKKTNTPSGKKGGGKKLGNNKGKKKNSLGGGPLSTPPAGSSKKKQPASGSFSGGGGGGGLPALHTGTRVFVTNLKEGVDSTDLNEIFAKVGMLKGIEMRPNQNAATVTFKLRADAIRAVDDFNGRSLDGNPMKLRMENEPGMKRKNPPGSAGGNNNNNTPGSGKKKNNPNVKRQKTGQ